MTSRLPIFQQFPQISLDKVYNSINRSRNHHNKPQQQSIGKVHHTDIEIKSPFYQRHQNYKGACQCPYHRMKRYKEQATIMKYQPNTKVKDELEEYKMRIAVAIKNSTINNKMNVSDMTQKENKRVFRNTEGKPAKNIPTHPIRKRDRINLDNYNEEFQEILRMRMLPLQDHEKVSSLIKFIKIQSNHDEKYLSKIRDPIMLNLLRVVQKIKLDKILQAGDNDIELVQKISQMVNTKQDITINFIKGVKKAMKDFEQFIIRRAKAKQLQIEKQKQRTHSKGLNYTININKKMRNSHSFYNNNNDQLSKTKYGEDGQPLNDGQNDSQLRDKTELSIYQSLNSHSNDELTLWGLNNKNVQRRGSSLLKEMSESSRRRILLGSKKSSLLGRLSKIIPQHQLQEILAQMKAKGEEDQIGSQEQIQALGNTLNLGQDQSNKIQGQANGQNTEQNKIFGASKEKFKMRASKFMSADKRNSINSNNTRQSSIIDKQNMDQIIKEPSSSMEKQKKGRLHNKKRTTYKAPPQKSPFDGIKYEEVVSKDEFDKIKLIVGDGKRVGENQQKKMDKLFNFIERRLQNSEDFFDNFVQKFTPALKSNQIMLLRSKYNKYEYDKMISKLTKQVDTCLMELKYSDEMIWRDHQQDDLHGERNRDTKKKTINLQCVNTNEALIEEFKKFTIVEKSVASFKSAKKEVQVETFLQQKDLGQIEIDKSIIVPDSQLKLKDLTENAQTGQQSQIDCEEKDQSQQCSFGIFSIKQNVNRLNKQKHRQILRYMKQKHPNIFHQVFINIKDTLQNIDPNQF